MPKQLSLAQSQRVSLDIHSSPTLDSWQSAPDNRWVFRHFDELHPTAKVSHVPVPAQQDDAGLTALTNVRDLELRLLDTCTDALVVERGGRIVAEWYASGFPPDQNHLLMSVSKSLCSLVIGTLVADGLIDTGVIMSAYVPALKDSAFGDATVQQMLDMVAAVVYREEYTDPTAEVQQHDRSARWREPRPDDAANTFEFLTTLQRSKAHGQSFLYCSAVTDALGWLIEEVTGQRYAQVLSARLWSQIGARNDARVSVDRDGCAIANGGVTCTARDLSIIGRLMLNHGRLDGNQIVPEAWVQEIFAGGDPAVMDARDPEAALPNFTYKNQWWHSGNARGNVHAVGIHGQYLWLDPLSDTSIVKFSSLPRPVHVDDSRAHFTLFADIITALENR